MDDATEDKGLKPGEKSDHCLDTKNTHEEGMWVLSNQKLSGNKDGTRLL